MDVVESSRLDRIRQLFGDAKLSISAYDTAWVAMVPQNDSTTQSLPTPFFPPSLNWVLQNQLQDGSFDDFHHLHPSFTKSSLCSALACVLALKTWNVGDTQIEKGMWFICSNFEKAMESRDGFSTIGFEIIFTGLLDKAREMGLRLILDEKLIDDLRAVRDMKIKKALARRSERAKAELAYLAEGSCGMFDWNEIMKYQRKNGSLFNSPSATAAAFINLHDARCIDYLTSLIERHGNAVPIYYPIDIHVRLSLIDTLERLGIDRHFKNEIASSLEEAYKCWLAKDEDILSDISTMAIAFRHLRMNGYNVCLDFKNFSEIMCSCETDSINDIKLALELYKASQVMINKNEVIMEELNSWSRDFLKQVVLKNIGLKEENHVVHILNEVDYTLKFPYHANLERLASRRHIENYKAGSIQISKTPYRIYNICNDDLLNFATEDFNKCQSVHQKELKQLEKWTQVSRLDQLKFARQKLSYCYFSVAATLFPPEMSASRISWTKNSILTTVVDDFFDIGGTMEELANLIDLTENWGTKTSTSYCSVQVEIVFLAICNTINELHELAIVHQGRNVKDHLIRIWIRLLKSMMKEAEWTINKKIPLLQEYMDNAWISFALGPILLPALYFLGPVFPEDVVEDLECERLYYLTSMCGRMLNDIQGFKREDNEGKLNSISLYVKEGCGSTEEAITQLINQIDVYRKELLSLVLQTSGSVVPRACKDIFWKMTRVLHLFYARTDGFSSPKEMMSSVSAVIHAPLVASGGGNINPLESRNSSS